MLRKLTSSWLVKAVVMLLLTGFLFSVSGCNTVKGAGKDVERAGEKMQGE